MTDVIDLRSKLDALVAFRAEEAFEPLAEVFKRAINITKTYTGPLEVSERLFESGRGTGAPRGGPRRFGPRRGGGPRRPVRARRSGRWRRSQPLVAAFFDKVLVMAEDEAVRNNRLALLKGLSAAFSSVADFSRVASPGRTETVTGSRRRGG